MQSNEVVVSVDCLLMTADGKVVLIRRATSPCMGMLALPGGKVEGADRTFVEACIREVGEELGMYIPPSELKLLMLLDTPGRDPRSGLRVSIVFAGTLPEGVEFHPNSREVLEVVLVPLSSIAEIDMAFDHYKAIHAVIQARAV